MDAPTNAPERVEHNLQHRNGYTPVEMTGDEKFPPSGQLRPPEPGDQP